MPKTVKLIIAGCIILIIINLLLFTVWGQSIKIFEANNFFKAKAYDKAEAIYEDLAVDLPASPVIKHNLGLCLYQVGLYEQAVNSLSKSLPKKNLSQPEPVANLKQADIYYYHLANAFYKAASKNGLETENAVKLYTAALNNYKKALLVNPNDLAAKYNYELTVIHLKQIVNKPQNQQNKEQEVENLLQNTQNSDQYKVKPIEDNNPPNGKDW
jgi:tetratricopeptide (TPR) repeat protein